MHVKFLCKHLGDTVQSNTCGMDMRVVLMYSICMYTLCTAHVYSQLLSRDYLQMMSLVSALDSVTLCSLLCPVCISKYTKSKLETVRYEQIYFAVANKYDSNPKKTFFLPLRMLCERTDHETIMHGRDHIHVNGVSK